MIRGFVVVVMLSLCVAAFGPAPAMAQDISKGRAAFDRGDYATALKEFTSRAKQGDAEAQFGLGLMHDLGNGVTQNLTKAEGWYRLAAGQGYAEAQFYLGNIFFRSGKGDPKDFPEAVKWYRKAAAQGHTKAQFTLGMLYSRGDGVPKNDVLSYMWYDLAAGQSPGPASYMRNLTAARMNKADIKKAKNLSTQCLARKYKDC